MTAVILACSASKQRHPARALDLYTGPLFASARRWALSVVPASRIWVLSARHGLVNGSELIAPYDYRARDADELVQLMARVGPHLAQLRAGPVFAVGGSVYRQAIERVLPEAITLSSLLPAGRATRGIGAQRGWLRRHEGQLPDDSLLSPELVVAPPPREGSRA